MTKLTKHTRVIVADSDRAMILTVAGKPQAPELHLFQEVSAPDMGASTDRPGRVQESAGTHHSALEEPDYRRIGAEMMVGDLLDLLAKQHSAGEFDQLVLVAPPQVLGAMRDRMPAGLAGIVVAEVHKTLTKHPLSEIAERITAAD